MPYRSVCINSVLRFALCVALNTNYLGDPDWLIRKKTPVATFIKATLSESTLTTELKNVRFFVAFSLTYLRVYDK